MDGAKLIGAEFLCGLIRASSLFLFLLLYLVKLSDDLLRHFWHIGGKDGLKFPHERLEERVVEDFVAQMENLAQAGFGFFDARPWVLTCLLPGLFLVEGRQLKDYLDFRRVEAL